MTTGTVAGVCAAAKPGTAHARNKASVRQGRSEHIREASNGTVAGNE
jgi:hypothetical protein